MVTAPVPHPSSSSRAVSARPPRRAGVIAQLAIAALALAAVASVTGCATSPEPEPTHRIATLETPSASPSDAPSTPPTTGSTGAGSSTDALFAKYGSPPRERLDETDEESLANQKPYDTCLAENGGALVDPPKGGGGPVVAREETPELMRAEAYCAPLQPLPPLEYDRQNPDALHFVQAVVDCLKSKGVKGAAIAPDDGGGRWNIQFDDAGAGLRWIEPCQRVASAARG